MRPLIDGKDSVKDALLFARQLAEQEIASIDRIHKRTLLSFGYIGVVAAALFAVFGYIGYSNLRDAAVVTARAQMSAEVTRQVQDKLKTENINQIVRDQIQDLTKANLTTEIAKELRSPPLSSSIRQAATDEAQRQISKEYSARHLDPAHCKTLAQELARMSDLSGYAVAVASGPFNGEATIYGGEIRACIAHSTMAGVDHASFDKDAIDGVGIYYQQHESETYARELRDALQAAGINATLVPGMFQGGSGVVVRPGDKTPLEIYVGNKPLR